MFFPKVRLELTTIPLVYNFEKKESVLSIQRQAATLEISAPPAKLDIDQTLPREEAGFRNMLSFARYSAEQARENVLNDIAQIAEEGDRMAKIELPKSGLVEIAEQELYQEPAEINIQGVPMTPPSIRGEVAPLSISVNPGSLSIHFEPATFQHRFQYGSVKGQLVSEKNTLDVTV